MTKEQLAATLNGRKSGDEMTSNEECAAKSEGLVVVFGASDDLCEFRGALDDEAGCYDGGIITIDACGFLSEWDDLDKDDQREVESWLVRSKKAKEIKAIWGGPDYSWQYDTAIPHACFDVLEDGEKYCKGIVFSISDL